MFCIYCTVCCLYPLSFAVVSVHSGLYALYSLLITGYNDTIEVLDLSWNHLRNDGAKELALGLEVMHSYY